MTAGLEKEKKRILFPQKQTNQNKKKFDEYGFSTGKFIEKN